MTISNHSNWLAGYVAHRTAGLIWCQLGLWSWPFIVASLQAPTGSREKPQAASWGGWTQADSQPNGEKYWDDSPSNYIHHNITSA